MIIVANVFTATESVLIIISSVFYSHCFPPCRVHGGPPAGVPVLPPARGVRGAGAGGGCRAFFIFLRNRWWRAWRGRPGQRAVCLRGPRGRPAEAHHGAAGAADGRQWSERGVLLARSLLSVDTRSSPSQRNDISRKLRIWPDRSGYADHMMHAWRSRARAREGADALFLNNTTNNLKFSKCMRDGRRLRSEHPPHACFEFPTDTKPKFWIETCLQPHRVRGRKPAHRNHKQKK